MKKSIIPSSGSSDPEESIISYLETRCRGPVRALFERIYPSPADDCEWYLPPVRLRYMIDDYWELLCQANSD